MIDRLDLKSEYLGRGKIFGPEDWFSFNIFTLLIYILLFDNLWRFKNFTLKDLQKKNVQKSMVKDDTYKNK